MECGDDLNTEGESSESPETQSITFTLEAEKKNDFHVTVPEVAKLVYGRLNAPPKTLVSYDDTMYKKLTIVLKSTFRVDTINYRDGLVIRPGLRTKPLAEKVPEKRVHIFWAPKSITNEAIEKVLHMFGEVTVGVENKVYEAKETDNDVTKMMDGVILPDRQCKMIIRAQIPSHVLVGGVKVKILYEGQSRTCARCFKFWSQCPGKGNSGECKKLQEAAEQEKVDKGETIKKKKTLGDHMKKLESKLEKKMASAKEAEERANIDQSKVPLPTSILIENVPLEVTLPQIINLFKKNNTDLENLTEKIVMDNVKPGTIVLKDLDRIDHELVTENINGVYLSGKRLRAIPLQDVTPEKGDGNESEKEEDVEEENPVNKTPKNIVKNLASKFQEQTPGGSKVYSRVAADGSEVSVKKTSRDPDSPTSEVEGSPQAKAKDNVTTRQARSGKANSKKPKK